MLSWEVDRNNDQGRCRCLLVIEPCDNSSAPVVFYYCLQAFSFFPISIPSLYFPYGTQSNSFGVQFFGHEDFFLGARCDWMLVQSRATM